MMDKSKQVIDPLPPEVQECIDAYGRYYAEQHKLGMSVRDDMKYVASVAIRSIAVPEIGLSSFTDEDRRLAEVTIGLLTRNWPNRANMSHHQGDLIVRALKAIAAPQSATRTSGKTVRDAREVTEDFSGPPAVVSTIGPLSLDTDRQVFFYEQDHYYLSNFSAFKVGFCGRWFNTAEQAYHFQRFSSVKDQNNILDAKSAHDAFRYAQDNKHRQIDGWDDLKFTIMRDILRAKAAQHEYVRRKLLQTGDRELVENSWRDPVWGWGPNRDGQNMLGKLWMEVRAELRASTLSATQPITEEKKHG